MKDKTILKRILSRIKSQIAPDRGEERKASEAALISIVAPVYNGEAFLREFVDSVRANTYENWQLLMVDDGSTDGSAQIIKDYSAEDGRIMYIQSTHHDAGFSRNIGLDSAEGEFICFLDCDDLVSPDYLEEMHRALTENDADLVFCRGNAYLQDSGEFKDLKWGFRQRFFPETADGCFNRKTCPDNLFQTNFIAAWNKMARMSLLKDNNIRAQSIPSANDVVLTCLMMACSERIVPVDNVLYTQRRNNKSSITAGLGSATARCGYLSSEMLHDELVRRGLYDDLRISYEKLAAHNCVWYLEKVENDYDVLRAQYEFLRKEGFKRLGIDRLDSEAEKGFLDKKELHRYRDIKSMTVDQYCVKYGIAVPQKAGGDMKDKTEFEAAVRELFDKVLHDRQLTSGTEWVALYRVAKEAAGGYKETDFPDGRFRRYLRIIKKHDLGTILGMLGREVIVSFTSYPVRIPFIAPTVVSLSKQNMPADRIVLWLADSQFGNRESDIPGDVLDTLKENNVEICWCPDVKAHKKYLYSMRRFPEANIITVDDDLIYEPDFMEELYLSYLEFPDCVSANRVHLILFDRNEKPIQYSRWVKEARRCLYTPAMQLIATGGAGTLYPAGLLDGELLDERLINEICPLADDLWLKAVELTSNVPVVLANDHYEMNVHEPTQAETLFSKNGGMRKNDEQIRAILKWFTEKYGRDILTERILRNDRGVYLNDPYTVIEFLFEERKKLKQQNSELKEKLKNR